MMTNRPTDPFAKDCYSKPESRLNQQIKCKSKSDEGCPVIDESGTVCGETNSLSIFKEFRNIYEDCLRKLEESPNGSALLEKLAPFTKIVDDLWEQNTMLVEAVEELEQEATCQVTSLQNKLDKSCQKELHCILKAKEREIHDLNQELSNKNDLIAKNVCQIEQLELDLKAKTQHCKSLIKRLKGGANKKDSKSCGNNSNVEVEKNSVDDDVDGDFDVCDTTALDKLMNDCVTNLVNEKNSSAVRAENAERQIHIMASDRKKVLAERNEMGKKLQCLVMENERLTKELMHQRETGNAEREELIKTMEQLKGEKADLIDKINGLHESMKDLNSNFKETRWALTTEVAEKHDQVQELKRCINTLEEQLLQADKQLQFKEDVVKELRKELKVSRKSASSPENHSKISSREHSPPTQLHRPQSLNVSPLEKPVVNDDDELKLDIHIFSNQVKSQSAARKLEVLFRCRSVAVQTEWSSSMRNVSTQHNTRVQKYPRSFGTLTVTPWSGASGHTTSDIVNVECHKETKKNLKGVFTVPFSNI